MNQRTRQLVKAAIKPCARLIYAGVSRQNVTGVVVRLTWGGQEYEVFATAKWQRPDMFDPQRGVEIAFNRALVELVDRVLETGRRSVSVRLV